MYWKNWITEEGPERYSHSIEDEWKRRLNTIYLLRTLYTQPLTSTSHLATAAVLETAFAANEILHDELLLAYEKCNDPTQKAEIHIRLSDVRQGQLSDDDDGSTEQKKHEFRVEILDHLNSAIDLIPDKTSYNRCFALMKKLSFLRKHNEFSHGSEIDREIIGIFHEIRACSPFFSFDRNHGSILENEIRYYEGRYDLTVNFFVELTPVQRVSLIMDLLVFYDPNIYILPAAVVTGRVAEVADLYQEILQNLDLAGCSTVRWYGILVNYLHRACRDLQMSSSVLQRLLAIPFTRKETSRDKRISGNALGDAEGYLRLASDILYQRFRYSSNPDAKALLLAEAESLPFQPLFQSVDISITVMLSYLVVLARMQKRMSSSQRYQETLQKAFDTCWANLHDDFMRNDALTLRYLSRILASIPGLSKDAEIACSAQPYYLYKLSDEELLANARDREDVEELRGSYHTYELLDLWDVLDDSEYWAAKPRCSRKEIGHRCPQNAEWENWTKPMYTCMCCAGSFLCQECYDERRKRNISSETEGKIDFCCDGGEYFKAPMDGWQGIRYGVIYIEGEEPLEFSVWLEQLRDKWKQAWDDFWKN